MDYYKLFFLFFTVSINFLLLISSSPIANTYNYTLPPSRPVTPDYICKFTPYPTSCKLLLPNKTSNVYDFARFTIFKSLSQTLRFQTLVNKFLHLGAGLPKPTVAALEDCQFLAGLNVEYLSSSLGSINATHSALPGWKTEDIQTLLSAILTNQETCYDGLKSATSSSWMVRKGLFAPLANDTKLFSVSLALFTKGWVPNNIKEKLERSVVLETGNDVDHSKVVVVREQVTVSQDGSGNFTSINDAVAAAPNKTMGSGGYFVIHVKAGVYEEYVSIGKNKRYLMLIGDGINQTVITGNRSVVDGWTTFKSATFAVTGQGFVAVNITFRNTAGASKHQAVAVRNSADLSAFYSCSFEGYQDTLYTHSLRQFYRQCDIYGTVDFIFGNAAVVFQNCNLFPRLPMNGQFNAITAQGRTDPNQNTGISIHNCTVRAADDLAASSSGGGNAKTYLGRPWKEYSRTVYMQSYMDNVVDAAGWREWNGDFGLSTLYYAEHDNRGPGSETAKRVTWPGYHVINATDAENFTLSSFLLADNWLPQTGVAYTNGLI